MMTLPVKPVTGVRGSEACAPPTTLLETRPPELETTPPGPVKALEIPLLLNAGPAAVRGREDCGLPTLELRGRAMRAGPEREGALRNEAAPTP